MADLSGSLSVVSGECADNDKDALLGTKTKPKPKQTKTKYCWIAFIILLILVGTAAAIYFLFFAEESISNPDFLTIQQPTSIYLNDDSNFVLHVDYCNFTLLGENYDDINNESIDIDIITLININTRCYCWNYSESTGIKLKKTKKKDFNLTAYNCGIPGPTLFITNNISFNITIVNDLEGAEQTFDRHNLRLWPDVTNLHTHGLHVDPVWDDVFTILNPGSTRIYHYEIPQHHYPGTHWYHPHIHGSTNYQVLGGMFGALIVEQIDNDLDNFDNVNRDNDDDDDDDENDEEDEITDIFLIFHHFYFYTDPFCDCYNKTEQDLLNEYTFRSDGLFRLTSLCYEWCILPIDIRNISGFEYFADSDVSDPDNGLVDIMLVNSQFEPTVNIESNKWYKLRMINADGQFYTQISFENVLNENNTNINNLCNIHLLGNDGIFFNKSRNLRYSPYHNEMIIGPGSRADIAIKCEFNTNYTNPISIHFSKNFLSSAGIPRYPEDNTTIFYIKIHENPQKNKIKNIDLEESPHYIVPEFPHYLIMDEDVIPTTTCPCFTYNESDTSCHFRFGGTTINGQAFDVTTPFLQVCADEVYEFEVSGIHPIHIHNTPFQVQRDLPFNQDINISNGDIDANGFIAQNGDWRDTISANDGNYNIRYPTGHFSGPIIMHCHFLPHEDDGMINYFEIIDCNDAPQCIS